MDRSKRKSQQEIDDRVKEKKEKGKEMTPVTVERTAEQIVNGEVIAIKLSYVGNTIRLVTMYVR